MHTCTCIHKCRCACCVNRLYFIYITQSITTCASVHCFSRQECDQVEWLEETCRNNWRVGTCKERVEEVLVALSCVWELSFTNTQCTCSLGYQCHTRLVLWAGHVCAATAWSITLSSISYNAKYGVVLLPGLPQKLSLNGCLLVLHQYITMIRFVNGLKCMNYESLLISQPI